MTREELIDLVAKFGTERDQLRRELSLAEEGLANYEEEMQARITLMQQKDVEIERLRALLTQAPIARVTITESFGSPDLVHWVMCAPGLPPGTHDLFLMPSVPQPAEQT